MPEYANPPLWGTAPSDGVVPVYSAASDSLVPTAGNAFGSPDVYGDGSDGVVTFTGTTARLGLTPSSKVYTLTRDVYLASGSAIGTGVTIAAGGYRLFCQGTLTNNGTIQSNGHAASGATGGTASTAHALGVGSAGHNGGTGAGTAGGTTTS